MGFISPTNYSRHFISDYAFHTAPLRGLFKVAVLSNGAAQLQWTPEAMNAFHQICLALANAATLGKPDYNSSLWMLLKSTTSACLFQQQQGRERYLGSTVSY